MSRSQSLIKAKAQKCLTTALYVRFNKCLITAIVQVSALQSVQWGRIAPCFGQKNFLTHGNHTFGRIFFQKQYAVETCDPSEI